MNFELQLIQVPVSDLERSIAFYRDKAGFNLDVDVTINENLRFVQMTPPGSACSIAFGKGMTKMQPGSLEGLQLVVQDVEAAQAELRDRGVEVSDVQTFDWGSFVFFNDPDGNHWAVQQMPDRS